MLSIFRKLLVRHWARRAERMMSRDRGAAIRCLDRALYLDRANPILLSMRAQAKGASDGAADHAAALALDPQDPTIHMRRAVTLHRDAETGALLRKATPAAKRRMMADAAERCGDALALDPRHAHARFLRASCLIELDDLAGAVADLTVLTELYPGDSLYICKIGEIQARSGAYEEAASTLTRALDLDADCQRAHATRAFCRLKRGDRSAAQIDVDEALKRDPHDELAHHVWCALEHGEDLTVDVPW